MITEALQAWVIHKSWSGDTSARVLFFTKEHGLINCQYKGARLPKNQALLQPFTPLWLSVDRRKNLHYVRKLEAMATAIPPASNLFAGLYVNELLYHALKPHDVHVELYDAYIFTLQALTTVSHRMALEALLRRFEWVLLSSCGYSISLTQEAHTLNPIILNAYYRFMAGEGFILAETGFLGAHLIALSEDKLEDLKVLQAAKRIMRQAIDHALDGKEIKSRLLYRP